MADPCALVRQSAAYIMQNAEHVTIDSPAAEQLVRAIMDVQTAVSPSNFDHQLHFWDPEAPELVAQYLLVVDALNFCFWPDPRLEYEQLAGGVKASLLANPHALAADRLCSMDGPALRALLGWEGPLPLEAERIRLIQEVGAVLSELYGGHAANLVRSAAGSATWLVALVTASFPGFRDHCVYRGRQIFFYKRAQIFVADMWGCFGGTGLGSFHDIQQLTMFADYRVPVVLRELGVLRYSADLAALVDSRDELAPGSQLEVEIRAATIMAVELIKNQIKQRLQGEGDGIHAERINSVVVDWWLWEQGSGLGAAQLCRTRCRRFRQGCCVR